ncbi:hypothetical protein X739_00700 [Mesorhizobium sp. LNHC220B00]|nr:hypothetical protein [Mesorhizobium sp. LNHC220B00]ESY89046.1 hypothetical protein X739_00700 [Mesorhizobium sp. LNHC220B00]
MDYQVGQLVACVDDNFRFTRECELGMVVPHKGTVYRIRTLDLFRVRGSDKGVPFLRFDEIHNPSYSSVVGLFEPVFEASAFLPLDPKRLDVFRLQIAPVDRLPA